MTRSGDVALGCSLSDARTLKVGGHTSLGFGLQASAFLCRAVVAPGKLRQTPKPGVSLSRACECVRNCVIPRGKKC